MASKKGSTPVVSDKHNAYFQAISPKYSQYVNFTGTAAESAILDDETSICRVFSTQDCWISVIASGGTAAAAPSGQKVRVSNIKRLRGGIVDFIGVPPALTNPVISVISDGTNGVLDIEEGQ